ncbi:MAG: hypothetical protein ACTHJ4_05190 [Candidatus Nucleicultricaceae bacterium]
MKKIITGFILTTPLLTLPLTADIASIRKEIEEIEIIRKNHQSAIAKGLGQEVQVTLDEVEGRLKTCVVNHFVINQSLENRIQKLKHALEKEELKALLSPQLLTASPNTTEVSDEPTPTEGSDKEEGKMPLSPPQRLTVSSSPIQTRDELTVGPMTQSSDKESTLSPARTRSSQGPLQNILTRSFDGSADPRVFTKSEAERRKTKLQLLHHTDEDPVWDKLFKTRYALSQGKDLAADVPHVSTAGDGALQGKDEGSTAGNVKKVSPAISFTTYNPLPIPTKELDKEFGTDHINTVKLSEQLVALLEGTHKPTKLIGGVDLRDDSILKPVYFIVLCELFLRENSYDYAMQALGEALKSNITSNQSIKIKLYFSHISSFMPTDLPSYRQIADILDM